MKIAKIETFMRFATWRNVIMVKVTTDDGIEGIGEATLRNKEKAVYAAIENHLKPQMIGRDVYSVNHMIHEYYAKDAWRSGGGVIILTAISGVEAALWDIIGKSVGEPVYNLFGGQQRDRVRCYMNDWFRGFKGNDDFINGAKRVVSLGFTAMKWDPLMVDLSIKDMKKRVDMALENVFAIREAVGPDVDLLIELHSQLCYDDALRFIRGVEDAKVGFIEEPVYPDDIEGFKKLAVKSKVPIAAGERIFSRYGYRYAAMREELSVAQTDLTHTGGMMETKLIGDLVRRKHMTISPHNSNNIVASVTAAMVDCTMPNFIFQEMTLDAYECNHQFIKQPVEFENGHMILPNKPGLGIEIDWDEFLSVPYRDYFSDFTEKRPYQAKYDIMK